MFFTEDLIELGVAKETTRGTAVNPTTGNWAKIIEFKPAENYVKKTDPSRMGLLSAYEAERLLSSDYMGNWKSNLDRRLFTQVLIALMGTNVDTGSGPSYTHTITRSDSNLLPSLTIGMKNPNESLTFALSIIKSLKIGYSVDNFLQYDTQYIAVKKATATLTSSYPTQTGNSLYLPWMVTIKLAANVAGLAGATAIKVITMNQEFMREPIKLVHILGQKEGYDIVSGELQSSGDMMVMYENNNYKTPAQSDDTYQAMSISIIDPNTSIGGVNPSLTFTYPKVSFSDWNMNPSKDFVEGSFKFKNIRDDTNGDVSIVSVNDVASY